jgi:hypothetical protein
VTASFALIVIATSLVVAVVVAVVVAGHTRYYIGAGPVEVDLDGLVSAGGDR